MLSIRAASCSSISMVASSQPSAGSALLLSSALMTRRLAPRAAAPWLTYDWLTRPAARLQLAASIRSSAALLEKVQQQLTVWLVAWVGSYSTRQVCLPQPLMLTAEGGGLLEMKCACVAVDRYVTEAEASGTALAVATSASRF